MVALGRGGWKPGIHFFPIDRQGSSRSMVPCDKGFPGKAHLRVATERCKTSVSIFFFNIFIGV